MALAVFGLLWGTANFAQAQINLLKKAKERVKNAVEDKTGDASGKQPAPSTDRSMSPQGFEPIPGVAANQLLKLGPGQRLAYDESRLVASGSGQSPLLVIKENNKFLVYQNGQMNGPYDQLTPALMKQFQISTKRESGAASHKPSFARLSDAKLVEKPQSYMGQAVMPLYDVQMGGKSFGIYGAVAAFQPTPEGFFAVVIPAIDNGFKMPDPTYKCMLINHKSLKIPLGTCMGGQDTPLALSPDGQNAAVTVYDFATSKINIFTASGQKYGLDPQTAGNVSPYFSSDSQSLCWFLQRKFYVNGEMRHEFAEGTDMNTVLMNHNGTRWVEVSYRGLKFSDGQQISNAFSPATLTEGGKEYLTWLAAYPDGSVYLCRRDF